MVSKILRKPEVIERIGLSNSTLYLKIQKGEFPKPIKLGERSVGWLESDINDWIKQQAAKSQEVA